MKSAPALTAPVFLFAFAVALFVSPPVRAASAELANAPSAFLRAQAPSPVAWESWSEAAFARAKKENKPLFVTIGLSTSELSRAMNRQTFSNQDTAALLNESFVCVAVDAKERPDLVALYQAYISATKQLSGLPLNLWLTPELKPFEGANYLPPTEEWGKEGFLTVAKRAAAGWKADPAAQRAKADEAVATVTSAFAASPAEPVDAKAVAAALNDARESWRARYDSANGGFNDPPKYLEPELLRFLLRDVSTRDLAVATLRAICNGAIHDPLDGGFFRYAVGAEWHQPYFQKTALDQARIALAFLDANRLAPDPQFAAAARDALNHVLNRLVLGDGEFAAAEDFTEEKTLAACFWTPAEVNEALGGQAGAEFARVFAITAEGNLPADAIPGTTGPGKNLPRRTVAFSDPAAEKALAASAAKLLARRDARAKPVLDDAAPSGAHGLLLAALSRAGAELSEPRFTEAAEAQFAFIRRHLVSPSGNLARIAGRSFPAAPLDYAMLVTGLEAFHAATRNADAGQLAAHLFETAKIRFWDATAGNYLATPAPADPVFWLRPRPVGFAAGEPVSVEAAMLLSGAAGDLGDKLTRTVVAEVRDASDSPRGDLLLALVP